MRRPTRGLYWSFVARESVPCPCRFLRSAAFSALRFAARGLPPRHAKTACAGDQGPAAQGRDFFRELYGTFRFAHPGLKPWTGQPRFAALISRKTLSHALTRVSWTEAREE